MKEIDEFLEKVFANVTTWLTFAEAKNAANIAFVIACIAAIYSIQTVTLLLNIVVFILIVSGALSLFTMYPQLGTKVIFKTKNTDVSNLIYFDTIKEYNENSYLQQISQKYFDINAYIPTQYQLDLTKELIYNSSLVSCKCKLFRIALFFDIIALLLLAISVII